MVLTAMSSLTTMASKITRRLHPRVLLSRKLRRHVATHHHWVRRLVREGTLAVVHVPRLHACKVSVTIHRTSIKRRLSAEWGVVLVRSRTIAHHVRGRGHLSLNWTMTKASSIHWLLPLTNIHVRVPTRVWRSRCRRNLLRNNVRYWFGFWRWAHWLLMLLLLFVVLIGLSFVESEATQFLFKLIRRLKAVLLLFHVFSFNIEIPFISTILLLGKRYLLLI